LAVSKKAHDIYAYIYGSTMRTDILYCLLCSQMHGWINAAPVFYHLLWLKIVNYGYWLTNFMLYCDKVESLC